MKHENEYVCYWFAYGILHIVYKPYAQISIKAAKKITLDRLVIQDGIVCPVFCDISEVDYFTKAARVYFAQEGCLLINALGIMACSPVSKIISSYYLSLAPPVAHIGLFTEKHLAMSYLSKYRIPK